MKNIREKLIAVLKSADIQALEDDSLLGEADFSIHLLGSEYGESRTDNAMSDDEYWFKKACKHKDINESFRIFAWQPIEQNQTSISTKQTEFINRVRNNIHQNFTFCTHTSPVLFVEDILSVLSAEQHVSFDTKATDVFFIYNELDEDWGSEIADLLSDVVKVEKLSISQKIGVEYAEHIAQQIKNSHLTTIYFNRTASWALSFTKQIWKNIGGVSANRKILLIGDKEQQENKEVVFDAPNISYLTTDAELIPLETKVFYDRMIS